MDSIWGNSSGRGGSGAWLLCPYKAAQKSSKCGGGRVAIGVGRATNRWAINPPGAFSARLNRSHYAIYLYLSKACKVLQLSNAAFGRAAALPARTLRQTIDTLSPDVLPSARANLPSFCAIYVTPRRKNRFVAPKKVFCRLMGLALRPGFVFPRRTVIAHRPDRKHNVLRSWGRKEGDIQWLRFH
jgi:hypothetical protein